MLFVCRDTGRLPSVSQAAITGMPGEKRKAVLTPLLQLSMTRASKRCAIDGNVRSKVARKTFQDNSR